MQFVGAVLQHPLDGVIRIARSDRPPSRPGGILKAATGNVDLSVGEQGRIPKVVEVKMCCDERVNVGGRETPECEMVQDSASLGGAPDGSLILPALLWKSPHFLDSAPASTRITPRGPRRSQAIALTAVVVFQPVRHLRRGVGTSTSAVEIGSTVQKALTDVMVE